MVAATILKESRISMSRTISFLGAVALAFAATPALSADEPFTEGAKAYELGLASSLRPEEQDAFTYCAGYWSIWAEAVDTQAISADQLALLPAELAPPSIEMQAIAFLLMLEETPALEAELEGIHAEARELIDLAKNGDVQAGKDLFSTLGICQL